MIGRTVVARITFIESDGREQRVEVRPGMTLMQGARNAQVDGILADCGGNCACGTCRVYIDPAFRHTVGEANELEAATIEAHEDSGCGKRLACQIVITEALDGLVVRMPAKQF
jgi:ferredoxin, 2Fe-2S